MKVGLGWGIVRLVFVILRLRGVGKGPGSRASVGEGEEW
jgi:hypothetical protein